MTNKDHDAKEAHKNDHDKKADHATPATNKVVAAPNAERPSANPPVNPAAPVINPNYPGYVNPNQQQYVDEVMAADPGRRIFARIEGLETAEDKRRRSLDAADAIAEKNVHAQADAMAKKAAARQAARDAVDGILKDIDSAINAVIDEGARVVRFPVPMEKDEDREITDLKVNDLIAALTALGYNVSLHDPRPAPEHFPIAAGDEIVEKDESKDDSEDDEDEDFFGPTLLISW